MPLCEIRITIIWNCARGDHTLRGRCPFWDPKGKLPRPDLAQAHRPEGWDAPAAKRVGCPPPASGMVMIKITVEDRLLRRNLAQLADKDIRWAAKDALDSTAQDVLDHVRGRMARVFDRPTRFTLNAFRIKKARTNNLEAVVSERDSVGKRHFLKRQELGGQRDRTGLESLLDARLAYDGIISAVTPASGARLDAHGNWSTGERNQALSAVQAQRDKTANTTSGSRRRNKRRAGFFVPRAGSSLSPGIWKRDPDGSISKVLHFTRAMPVYTERLGFFDGAEHVWRDRLPRHLRLQIGRRVAKLPVKV